MLIYDAALSLLHWLRQGQAARTPYWLHLCAPGTMLPAGWVLRVLGGSLPGGQSGREQLPAPACWMPPTASHRHGFLSRNRLRTSNVYLFHRDLLSSLNGEDTSMHCICLHMDAEREGNRCRCSYVRLMRALGRVALYSPFIECQSGENANSTTRFSGTMHTRMSSRSSTPLS